MSARIQIRSGSVRGANQIKGALRNAVLQGVANATKKAFGDLYPTIAKDTRRMARRMRIQIRRTPAGAGLKGQSDTTVIKIKQADVKRYFEAATHYAKYHITENTGKTFYKNPTTKGTFPVSVAQFMNDLADEIRDEVPKQLRLEGLDVS